MKSKPANGLGLPLSGIVTPVLSTRTEFSFIDTGLSPAATMMLKVPSMTKNIRTDAIIIPVIVAKV
jgi:hypothetical protein